MQRTIIQLKAWVEAEQSAATKSLDKFKENLEVNPHYAFEWSQAAFKAAGTLQMTGSVLRALEWYQKPETRSPEKECLEGIRDEAYRAVMGGARNPARSSSPTSNLIETETVRAWADLLNWIDGRSF